MAATEVRSAVARAFMGKRFRVIVQEPRKMEDKDGWFDGQGLDLLREDFLDHHEGWKKYIEDGQITAEEILEQENRIVSMLRVIEPELDPAIHKKLTDILLEYEVLVNMALIHYPSVMDSEQYWSLTLADHGEDGPS